MNGASRKRKPKGLGLGMRRAIILPRRYGFSEKKFLWRLNRMVSMLKENGVVGTFPVTAIILTRHPALAKALDGMEVAIHGYRHRDISDLGVMDQNRLMRTSVETFVIHGLKVSGFRAPYLRSNEATLIAVGRAGLSYDSSTPSAWRSGGKLDDDPALRTALLSYGLDGPTNRFPTMQDSIIEMPVAMPDDEILVDRLSITSNAQLTGFFLGMLDSAEASGGHLVFQLHPERFVIFEKALEAVLKRAKEAGGWVAPLGEVAEWWRTQGSEGKIWPDGSKFALTITGDIDAVTLTDFWLRIFGR